MKRRLFALILTLTLLLPTFSSCSDKGTESAPENTGTAENTLNPEVEPEETERKSSLPDKDWGGRAFRVMGQTNPTYSQFSTHELYAAELTGEALNDAVFNRNLTIEYRYNIVFDVDETAETTPGPLHKMVLAGEDRFDLAFCASNQIGGVVLQGDFQDISHLDYVDYANPWWNEEVNQQISMAGHLYFTSSDYSLSDKQRVNVLMYNKDLLADMGFEDPIPMVREGTWTIDVMTDWVEKTGADLDGDGQMTDQDRYGLTMDSYNAFKTFVFALGGRIIDKDADDLPIIVMESDEMVTVIDKVIALTCTPQGTLFCNDFKGKVGYDYWDVSGNVFRAGRGLFINAFTHSLAYYSNSDVNFNVIPYPKKDEAQEAYYTLADLFAMLFGIPKTCGDREFTGFMLEALSWESTETTLHTYYDINCKRKYMYDETGPEMLDITFAGVVYDPALIYSWGTLNDILAYTIPEKGENVFASTYARTSKLAVKNMEKTIQQFSEIGG